MAQSITAASWITAGAVNITRICGDNGSQRPTTVESTIGTTTSDARTAVAKVMKWQSDSPNTSTALSPYRQPFTGTVGDSPPAGATMSRAKSLDRTESPRSSSKMSTKGRATHATTSTASTMA